MVFTVSSCARGMAILTILSALNGVQAGDEIDKYTWIVVCAGILAL